MHNVDSSLIIGHIYDFTELTFVLGVSPNDASRIAMTRSNSMSDLAEVCPASQKYVRHPLYHLNDKSPSVKIYIEHLISVIVLVR